MSDEPIGLDLEAVKADLDYASSGIDGADQQYHPHALAAMRVAEKLFDEVESLRSQLAEVGGAGIDVRLQELAAQNVELSADLAYARQKRDEFRQHILDIDAHATPYGDILGEPGWVGTYLLTAGALHRALGKIGHSAPKCQAEAELELLRPVAEAAKAWAAEGGLLSPYVEITSANLRAAVDALGAAEQSTAEDGAVGDEHDLDRLRENCRLAEEALKAELERRRIAERERRCGAIHSPPGMRGFFVCVLDKGHDGNHTAGDLHATEWPDEADSRAGQAGEDVRT